MCIPGLILCFFKKENSKNNALSVTVMDRLMTQLTVANSIKKEK